MANRAPADHSAYVMSQKGGRIALLHFLPASTQIGVAIPAAGGIRAPKLNLPQPDRLSNTRRTPESAAPIFLTRFIVSLPRHLQVESRFTVTVGPTGILPSSTGPEFHS
jgi:hypothetical protein